MASHKIKDHLSDGWKYLFGQFIHSFCCFVTLTHTVILRFSFRMFEKDSVKRDNVATIKCCRARKALREKLDEQA